MGKVRKVGGRTTLSKVGRNSQGGGKERVMGNLNKT